MVRKAIWISYDFGLKGDFTGLFTWLDNQNAVECGSGLAFFHYDTSNLSQNNTKDLIQHIHKEIKGFVNLTKADRIYLIVLDTNTQKVKGEFLNGNRKQSPWAGYGKLKGESKVDTDE